MEQLKELQEEVAQYKNTLVISHHKVVMLLDVIDGTDDYYWVTEHWGGEIHHETCVGGWTALKGVIPERDYGMMEMQWLENKRRFWGK